MGYSWEVDLHFYMKRAWALAAPGATAASTRAAYSTLVCGEAFALGPDQTFERTA